MADYFNSDLHLGHKKVIEYSKRPFLSVEEMNAALLENINSTVQANDNLFINGDLSFAKTAKDLVEHLKQINCKNLFWILGNHDRHFEDEQVKSYFKWIESYKMITIENQKIVLCHFPILQWDQGHRGAWMLHGHTHGDLEYPVQLKNKRIMDVGVDCQNYKPISFEQIKEKFKHSEDLKHH